MYRRIGVHTVLPDEMCCGCRVRRLVVVAAAAVAASAAEAPLGAAAGIIIFLLYSREYKNCGIVKKLFRNRVGWLFVFILFLDTRKGLKCMLWNFFTNQPPWASIDGHNVTLFSSF
jgi:hypothetical protein